MEHSRTSCPHETGPTVDESDSNSGRWFWGCLKQKIDPSAKINTTNKNTKPHLTSSLFQLLGVGSQRTLVFFQLFSQAVNLSLKILKKEMNKVFVNSCQRYLLTKANPPSLIPLPKWIYIRIRLLFLLKLQNPQAHPQKLQHYYTKGGVLRANYSNNNKPTTHCFRWYNMIPLHWGYWWQFWLP